MVDMDVLDKALDLIEKRDDEGLPDDSEAIVTNVEVTTREEIFGAGGKYGKPTDPYVTIYFDVMYGGSVLESGRVSYQISSGRTSKLAKYNRRYGRPKIGDDITVFLPSGSDYWDIELTQVND